MIDRLWDRFTPPDTRLIIMKFLLQTKLKRGREFR